MVKIAVASDNGMVAEHFGHCEGFTIFDFDGKAIVAEEFVPNPGHRPGFLPNFLGDNGVKVIISGGMGGGAINIFNERNMQVIVGASGSAKENAELFLEGKLQSTNSVCDKHEHADSCRGH